MVAAGAGTRSRAIGANGGVVGFRRIVRRTATVAVGEAPTEVGEIPIGAGERMAVGQVPTEAGVITAPAGAIPNCGG